jgi:NDP-sugar pyrophosphorylase family protein
MQSVAVLAGGLGTRLRTVTGPELPKALVPVAGTPFVDLKLAELRDRGAARVVMLVGHGGEQLREHVGDGSRHGLEVIFVEDGPVLLGTGGALRNALTLLDDPYWVTYGDTLVDVDVALAERDFAGSDADALMTVLHNRDAVEPSNVCVDGTRVVAYAKRPRPAGAEYIDYGMLLARHAALTDRPVGEPFDLAEVLGTLATEGRLWAFVVTEPFHDIGTPEQLRETERYLARRGAAN